MKVAIVTAHYIVGRGYMENVWADVLARQGHEVAVLASDSAVGGLSHEASRTDGGGMAVRRFPCRALPSGLRLAERGLVEELDRLEPDAILWVNVGSHFGKGVLEHKRRRGGACKLVCFFGENSGQHRFLADGRWMSPRDHLKTAGWRLLRGPLYRQAIAACDLAVGVTAQTPAIILSLFPPRQRERLEGRVLALPLGYDGGIFRYDRELRRATRRELGLRDGGVVFIVSSRMTPRKIRKAVRPLVLGIAEWLRRRPSHRAIVVGFSDTPPSEQFLCELATLDVGEQIVLHDLADRSRLNALFNAADVGVFASPSISVQEAMGTGLYMLVGDEGSMGHLLRSPEQGLAFRRGDRRSLLAAMEGAAARVGDAGARERRRAANAWLDYACLAERLFDRLLGHHGAAVAAGRVAAGRAAAQEPEAAVASPVGASG